MDKNQALLTFLQTCTYIQSNPLFFNFGDIRDGAHQMITQSDDVVLHKPFIDGSVQKRYTMSIDTFKSVAHNPVTASYQDENLSEFIDVQNVMDWINTQNDLRNYPNFGNNCVIEEMKTTTTKPTLLQVDTSQDPPVAIYRISIQIDYVDNSKTIWN